ncbi:hypothetical protein HYS79_01105 [Patescibacteria group bacterium]|nr:hypothetical protein [Patescibacteria group bacterium]
MIAGFIASRKSFLDRLIVPAIVVLVGLAAFGLGRLSALTEQKVGIIVHQPPALEP